MQCPEAAAAAAGGAGGVAWRCSLLSLLALLQPCGSVPACSSWCLLVYTLRRLTLTLQHSAIRRRCKLLLLKSHCRLAGCTATAPQWWRAFHPWLLCSLRHSPHAAAGHPAAYGNPQPTAPASPQPAAMPPAAAACNPAGCGNPQSALLASPQPAAIPPPLPLAIPQRAAMPPPLATAEPTAHSSSFLLCSSNIKQRSREADVWQRRRFYDSSKSSREGRRAPGGIE